MRRLARPTAWGAAALLLFGAVACVTFGRERKRLDATARVAAPGKFLQLHDGATHYDLSGPDSGRTMVLLSGFTVPFYLWDSTSSALAANGFRVLRYDYFGRGYSDRPDLTYNIDAYDRQLTELLDALAIRGPVDVAGVSMGGVIAASFADRHPDRVRTVTLVDPGFGAFGKTPFVLTIPGISQFLISIKSSLAKGQLDDFVHPENYPDWVSRYEVQMQYRGFRYSMLATMRGDVFKRPAASFAALAQGRTPMLILWGKADRTVPIARSGAVRSAFPRAEFHAIDGAAHLPQIEQAAVVDSILLRFLRER